MKKPSILFLTPYPTGVAGSQRFRFEQYYSILESEGINYEIVPFINKSTWDILYKKGHTVQKLAGTLAGMIRRISLLFRLRGFDYLFIHRGATVMGPPFFEWFASRILKKKIIFDFDDAIWKLDISRANRFLSLFKQPGKIPKIIKWSFRISAGNRYLADYAASRNDDIRITRTVVDTSHYHKDLQEQDVHPVHIGWTGTHTTLRYLEPLVPIMQQLEKRYDFKFFVICNNKPEWNLNSLVYIPWKKETEIEDLMRFHIGLMPLQDDEWANGKCGFKAIQYMSLGIVPLASDVGVNSEIVEDGISGLLIRDIEDWATGLEKLLCDEELRKKMGKAARRNIESEYSVTANEAEFLSLFVD